MVNVTLLGHHEFEVQMIFGPAMSDDPCDLPFVLLGLGLDIQVDLSSHQEEILCLCAIRLLLEVKARDGVSFRQAFLMHPAPSRVLLRAPCAVFGCHLDGHSGMLVQEQQALSCELRAGVASKKLPLHLGFGEAPSQESAFLQNGVVSTSKSVNVGITATTCRLSAGGCGGLGIAVADPAKIVVRGGGAARGGDGAGKAKIDIADPPWRHLTREGANISLATSAIGYNHFTQRCCVDALGLCGVAFIMLFAGTAGTSATLSCSPWSNYIPCLLIFCSSLSSQSSAHYGIRKNFNLVS